MGVSHCLFGIYGPLRDLGNIIVCTKADHWVKEPLEEAWTCQVFWVGQGLRTRVEQTVIGL